MTPLRCSIYTEGVQCLRAAEEGSWLCPEHDREFEAEWIGEHDDAYTNYLRQKRDAQGDSGV